MHGMFIHLDPTSGVVEPYTSDIQEILKQKSIPSEIHLGSKCFNATIHLRENGAHYQTTPAIRGPRGGKPRGYREVRQVTACFLSTNHKIQTPQGWRFSTTGGGIPIESVTLSTNKVALWQWCTLPNFSPDTEDWVCYESAVSDSLEKAWTTEGADNFELVIPVGITNKRIIVNRSHAFFRQQDTEITKNQRWVRRILMEETLVSRMRTEAMHNCPDDVCAICICTYTQTPMIPRTTLPCNHTFHSACLAPIIDKRCPMCRAEF